MIQGQKQKFLSSLIFKLRFEENQENVEIKTTNLFSPYTFLNAKTTGSVKGKVNFFGLLPMKSFVINIIPNILVVPSDRKSVV